MKNRTKQLQFLLTFGSLEFFGPALRDIGESHLQNPTWTGHSKVHMMWFIAYLTFSGITQVYLIWFREQRDYAIVLIWQLCNLLGFWTAVVLAPLYDGKVIDGVYHKQVFGINENILVFLILSSVWIYTSLQFRSQFTKEVEV